MKNHHLLCFLCFLIPISLFSQSKEPKKEGSAYTSESFIPIFFENNAFGYNRNIYFGISQQVIRNGRNNQAVFLNAGIKKYFSLSAGTIVTKFHDPQYIFLSPEFFYPVNDKLNLALQLKTMRSFIFDVFIVNPTALVSLGTPNKNITLAWAPYIDSDKNFEVLFPIDGIYSNGAFKLNGRYAINEKLLFFSNNEYTVADVRGFPRTSFFSSKSGINYHLKRVNVFAAILFLRNNTREENIRQYSFGIHYKLKDLNE